MVAAGSRRSSSASAARSANRSMKFPVGAAEAVVMPRPYHTFWYGHSVAQHHVQELLAPAHGSRAGPRAGQVQEADAGGERRVGAHVGLVRIESIVEKDLADRLEHPPIRAAHRIGDVL